MKLGREMGALNKADKAQQHHFDVRQPDPEHVSTLN